MWTLFIVAFIIVLVVVGYFAYQQNRKLMDDGVIVKRDIGFIKQKHLFTTNAEFMDFYNVFRENIARAGVQYNGKTSGLLHFKGNTWEGEFYKVKTNPGEMNRYAMTYTKWRTHKGIPYDAQTMNAVLTAIEKAFLTVDPETQVTRIKQQVTHKPTFL